MCMDTTLPIFHARVVHGYPAQIDNNGCDWEITAAFHQNTAMMMMPVGTTIPVCDATVDEWNAFVESENHKLSSSHMGWRCNDMQCQ